MASENGPGSGAAAPSAPPRRGGRSVDRFDALSDEIRACRRCPLGSSRTHAVVYRGSRRPRVVFVGEAPGAEEDRTGTPFVGRSGKILDSAVSSVGLAASEFGVLNVLKCRPPENRFDPRAARTCRPFLDQQIELLDPAVLVSLGAHALRALDPSAPPVLQAAGSARETGPRRLFPLVHPAASLRSRRMRARWEKDVASLAAFLRSAID